MKNFYVYILKCRDSSYYVGHTDDIERRLSEYHISYHNCYVTSRLPFKLVFLETCQSRAEAIEAEQQIKGWTRKKKELLISGGWQAVKGYSRNMRKAL